MISETLLFTGIRTLLSQISSVSAALTLGFSVENDVE